VYDTDPPPRSRRDLPPPDEPPLDDPSLDDPLAYDPPPPVGYREGGLYEE